MNKIKQFFATTLFFSIGSLFHMAYAEPADVPASQMSLSQFEQWLKSNGYAQNEQNTVATPETVATSSLSTSHSKSQTRVVETMRPPGEKIPPRRHPHYYPYRRPDSRPLTYRESQQAMLKSLPQSGRPPSPDSVVAFNELLAQNMPLSPEQVVELRQQMDLSQRAAAIPPLVPPKPVSSTLMINLAPGTTPPAVRLAQGYVSSLVFVDSTGAPWPIATFDIGNPKAINIQWDGKSNILILQSVAPYTNSDIVVRLADLPTPITLELVSGQRVVDYRVDLHVSGIGPNTKELPLGTNLPNSANQLLLGVLDGVPPAGSKLLTVRGGDAEAWMLGERIYLRTRFTILSPGWISSMISSDGMHAYEVPKTSSILISRYGEPADLKVEGF